MYPPCGRLHHQATKIFSKKMMGKCNALRSTSRDHSRLKKPCQSTSLEYDEIGNSFFCVSNLPGEDFHLGFHQLGSSHGARHNQEETAVFQGGGEKKSTRLWATQDSVQSDDWVRFGVIRDVFLYDIIHIHEDLRSRHTHAQIPSQSRL